MKKKSNNGGAVPPDPDVANPEAEGGILPPQLELEGPSSEFNYQVEWFDKDRFEQIIAASSAYQRATSSATISKYARDMRSGKWVFNGAPIRFDGNDEEDVPKMTDGFHRGHAVILANVRVQFMCEYGVPVIALRTMDNGRNRPLWQMFKLDGQNSPRILAPMIQYLAVFALRGAFTGPTFSSQEYFEVLEANPDAVKIAKEYDVQLPRNVVPGLIACAHYLCAQKATPEAASAFYDQVVHGVGLDAKDPAKIFRDWVVNLDDDYSAAKVGAVLIACWNKECQGEKIAKVPQVKRCPAILTPVSASP
jgi:hypothetical protein